MVTYDLTPPMSTKISSSIKFDNDIDSDLVLSNPDSLPYKCNNSPFGDRHRKNIVTGHLRIIKNNVLRNVFIKGQRYREVKHIHLGRAKYCILERFDNCILTYVVKMVLIYLSFCNGPTMLTIKVTKELFIGQIIDIHIDIQIAYRLQM